ncbi:cation:proton antiporter [Pyrofollis japonicus]|uniref:cation:proton antiporter n=1 Tax=Pyrofollis japonicus TaxID=3060460 RepID=UPI00295B4BAA|nr:cation:proton antiporter [Pyrofollis japonicus]
MSSAVLAEALEVAPAILELSLGFIAGLLGASTSIALDTLALIGSSALMFFAGLEMDPDLVKRRLLKSLGVGLISFLGPLAASATALVLAGYPLRESLIAATGVSTTSVAVVYAILYSSGRTNTEDGQTLLAAAMIADVASIVVFTVLVLKPGNLLYYYVASLIVAPLLLGLLAKHIPPMGHEAEIRIVLSILLSIILFSEAVGIHAVLFSFAVGLAFSPVKGVREEAVKKLEGIVFGFLAPLFFVTAGLEIASVNTVKAVPLLLLLLFSSYPAKVIATYAGLSLFLKSLKTSILRTANLFAARLTMSSIIAFAGLKLGIIQPELSEAILVTAIIVTLLAGLTSRKAIREEDI